jgi:phospholipid-binding lipoprotein MlaA
MRHITILWASMLCIGLSSHTFAKDNDNNAVSVTPDTNSLDNNLGNPAQQATQDIPVDPNSEVKNASKHPRIDALRELKGVKIDDLKVNASAAQAEEIKDPLQPLNRQIYDLNDFLDRNIARPLAVQYVQKVPTEVRGSYRGFRKNLVEPWNAVNQVAQGRFSRAAQTLGRFAINTVTTLGLADPASRLGLKSEEESLGTTLGYYGVPSGAYLMLPVLGPSTFRDSAGRIVDRYGKLQRYIYDGDDRLYYGDSFAGGIDSRSRLLELEDVLQGDRYSAIRDVYLQRKAFEIAEKKGLNDSSDLFVDVEDEEEFPAE